MENIILTKSTKIKIQSTVELQTIYSGQVGWIQQKGIIGNKDFYRVLTLDGNEIILHKSQVIEE